MRFFQQEVFAEDDARRRVLHDVEVECVRRCPAAEPELPFDAVRDA